MRAERPQRRAHGAPADAHRSGSLPIGDGHTVPRVAVQLDGSPDEWMATAVADLGVDTVAVPIYRWELPEDRSPARRVLQGVVDGSIDAVTFTAAHAVTNFFTIADELGLTDEVLAAFATGVDGCGRGGSGCADRARSFGIVDTIEPSTPRLGAMVRAFAADFTDRRRALTLGGHMVTLQGRMARVGDGDPVLLSDRERGRWPCCPTARASSCRRPRCCAGSGPVRPTSTWSR